VPPQPKVEAIERLTEAFSGTPHVILANFSGLTANQVSELRTRVRAAGGRYSVVKNRLAKRAAAGTAVEHLAGKLRGPCALVLHRTDPVLLAKTLHTFAKDNPQLELVAGVIDSREFVDAAGVKQLASLPGLPELRAQLLALIQTPATMLVRLLGTPGTQLARVVNARGEQGEQGAQQGS
jgi:large subunit ribosomal protein L10